MSATKKQIEISDECEVFAHRLTRQLRAMGMSHAAEIVEASEKNGSIEELSCLVALEFDKCGHAAMCGCAGDRARALRDHESSCERYSWGSAIWIVWMAFADAEEPEGE